MKSQFKQTTILIFSAILLLINSSCNDDLIERNEEFEALNPISADENAGSWKTYLLTSPDEFSIDFNFK